VLPLTAARSSVCDAIAAENFRQLLSGTVRSPVRRAAATRKGCGRAQVARPDVLPEPANVADARKRRARRRCVQVASNAGFARARAAFAVATRSLL
jgi:hypothetical protein